MVDEGWEPGEKQSLERLKLAIKYKQKRVCDELTIVVFKSLGYVFMRKCFFFFFVFVWEKSANNQFVAHPSVQQLLAAMWYEGLPGFRRKTLVAQVFI